MAVWGQEAEEDLMEVQPGQVFGEPLVVEGFPLAQNTPGVFPILALDVAHKL